jgi:hypothetical protein
MEQAHWDTRDSFTSSFLTSGLDSLLDFNVTLEVPARTVTEPFFERGELSSFSGVCKGNLKLGVGHRN